MGSVLLHACVFGVIGPPIGAVLAVAAVGVSTSLNGNGSFSSADLGAQLLVTVVAVLLSPLVGGVPALLTGVAAAFVPRRRRWLTALACGAAGTVTTLLYIRSLVLGVPSILPAGGQPNPWLYGFIGGASGAVLGLMAHYYPSVARGRAPPTEAERKSPAPESGAD